MAAQTQESKESPKFKFTSRKCIKCETEFTPVWWDDVLCEKHKLEEKFLKAGGKPGTPFEDMFGHMFNK